MHGLHGFKEFILRGNLVELATAFVVGAAFADLVKALVASFITPLIALVGGQPDFNGLKFTIHGTTFPYGSFLTAALSFLIISAVIYFLVVAPYNLAMQRIQAGEPTPDPTTRACPECASDIAIAARRCPMCTSQLAAAD